MQCFILPQAAECLGLALLSECPHLGGCHPLHSKNKNEMLGSRLLKEKEINTNPQSLVLEDLPEAT